MATTPTRAQITAADTELTALSVAMLVALVRQSPIYAADSSLYPDLENAIAGVSELKAQQLNAALTLIDELGSGEVEVKGDVDFSLPRERDALVGYCISVVYDVPVNSLFGFRRRSSSVVPAPAKW